MSSDSLYVTFTMDCEAIERDSPQGGPQTWGLAARAAEGFARTLLDAGMAATYFIIPDTARKQADLFRQLEKEGIELGMHCHPQIDGYKDFLAGYNVDQQKEIIDLGIRRWSGALGKQPETFRPGNASANDDTYIALVELGFTQGSVSLPERRHLGIKADWENAYPFAHHIDPLDRRVPGTIEFYEVPITSDLQKVGMNGRHDFTPRHLRIEYEDLESYAEDIIRTNVDRMVAENVDMKTLVFVTHNTQDYSDPNDASSARLRKMIELVKRLAGDYELKLVPATIVQVHDAADEAFANNRQ